MGIRSRLVNWMLRALGDETTPPVVEALLDGLRWWTWAVGSPTLCVRVPMEVMITRLRKLGFRYRRLWGDDARRGGYGWCDDARATVRHTNIPIQLWQ